MRISDWSSDVCSSDLFTPIRSARKTLENPQARPFTGPGGVDMVRPHGPAGEGKTVQDCAAPEGHAQQGGSRDPAMKIMTRNSHRTLAAAISAFLNMALPKTNVPRFSDMEISAAIHETVRDGAALIIQ